MAWSMFRDDFLIRHVQLKSFLNRIDYPDMGIAKHGLPILNGYVRSVNAVEEA